MLVELYTLASEGSKRDTLCVVMKKLQCTYMVVHVCMSPLLVARAPYYRGLSGKNCLGGKPDVHAHKHTYQVLY